MNRKVAIVVLVLMVGTIGLASADTFGIGLSTGAGSGGVGNTLLSVKLPQVPFLLGVGFNAGGGRFSAAFTADWWLYTTNLVNFVNLYAGPGIYLTVPDPLNVGIRVPVGINAYPIPVLELFFEIAPTFAILSGGQINFPSFDFQAALGFRFWFNA